MRALDACREIVIVVTVFVRHHPDLYSRCCRYNACQIVSVTAGKCMVPVSLVQGTVAPFLCCVNYPFLSKGWFVYMRVVIICCTVNVALIQ